MQLLFRIDLVSGLIVFEFDGTNNRLGRWAIVVDLNDLSNHGDRSWTPQDQRLTAAMIYKIDLESGRVWNIGEGMIGERRREGRQYSVNRCSMNGGQHVVIGKCDVIMAITWSSIIVTSRVGNDVIMMMLILAQCYDC